jgi:hypothetical protein
MRYFGCVMTAKNPELAWPEDARPDVGLRQARVAALDKERSCALAFRGFSNDSSGGRRVSTAACAVNDTS